MSQLFSREKLVDLIIFHLPLIYICMKRRSFLSSRIILEIIYMMQINIIDDSRDLDNINLNEFKDIQLLQKSINEH